MMQHGVTVYDILIGRARAMAIHRASDDDTVRAYVLVKIRTMMGMVWSMNMMSNRWPLSITMSTASCPFSAMEDLMPV